MMVKFIFSMLLSRYCLLLTIPPPRDWNGDPGLLVGRITRAGVGLLSEMWPPPLGAGPWPPRLPTLLASLGSLEARLSTLFASLGSLDLSDYSVF